MFIQAAARGQLDDFIKAYTADRTRLSDTDCNGHLPIHLAAYEGHEDIVEYIINENGGKKSIRNIFFDLFENKKIN